MGVTVGSHAVPVVVAWRVQICTSGPRLGVNAPEKDGCATIGGRKKKFGFPPAWAPSRISAEMRDGFGEVSDCWSRQPTTTARARHDATARFIHSSWTLARKRPQEQCLSTVSGRHASWPPL